MKYLYAFLIAILFAACTDKSVLRDLELAEVLIWPAPDSALVILENINPKSLNNDRHKADYGLLMTIARYRNYLPITNDTLISQATQYYKENDSPQYGMALFYLGATYQEKGYSNWAMDCCKEAAEQFIKTNDTKMLARAYGNLGELYGEQYFNKEALEYYKKSEQILNNLKDTVNLGFLYGCLGNTYKVLLKFDSAQIYYNKSIDIAQTYEDTAHITQILTNIGWTYFHSNKLPKSKAILDSCVRTYQRGQKTSNQYLLLANIAAAEKQYDSALDYLGRVNEPTLKELEIRREIYEQKHDYKAALEQYKLYQSQFDSLWSRREQSRIDEISARFDNKHHILENERLAASRQQWIIISILTLLAGGLFVTILYSRYRRYIASSKDVIEVLSTQQNRKNELFELMSSRETRLRHAIEKRLAIIGELIILSHEHKNSDRTFIKKFDALVTQNPLDTDALRDVVEVVNDGYKNIIDHLRAKYPALNDSEILICALTCVGFTSHQLFIIMNEQKVETIYNKKYKINAKLGMKGDLKNNLDQIIASI